MKKCIFRLDFDCIPLTIKTRKIDMGESYINIIGIQSSLISSNNCSIRVGNVNNKWEHTTFTPYGGNQILNISASASSQTIEIHIGTPNRFGVNTINLHDAIKILNIIHKCSLFVNVENETDITEPIGELIIRRIIRNRRIIACTAIATTSLSD